MWAYKRINANCFEIILTGHCEFSSMGDRGKGGIDNVCEIEKRLE